MWALAEALLQHDELAAAWRARHVVMVERMIGAKTGTGGSTGAGVPAQPARRCATTRCCGTCARCSDAVHGGRTRTLVGPTAQRRESDIGSDAVSTTTLETRQVRELLDKAGDLAAARKGTGGPPREQSPAC